MLPLPTMGIFQRQGLKYSIVNWLGILVSGLSTIFIFPLALEAYGLVRFLLDTSLLLFPVVSLGASYLILRYFPYFEHKPSLHHGFLGLMLLMGFTGCLLLTVVAIAFKDPIYARYATKNPLFTVYLWLVIPILFLNTANTIFFRYSINFKRIVIPSILLDVMPKVVAPVMIWAYIQQWLDMDGVLVCLIAYLLLSSIGFIAYIIHLKAWRIRFDLSFMPAQLKKEMWQYARYGIISGSAVILISKLDTWLVGSLLDLKKGGIYALSSFIANMIEVPSKALVGIGAPLISKYWMDGNSKEMEDLYRKVSINLLIMGLLLLGAFWVSVDAFFSIVANSEEMRRGKYVILILGLARLVDMATGLNNHLLLYSPKFRYSYIQIIIPAITSICLGYYWTLNYGMIGTAWATFISVVLYNAISLFINWYFFKLQPFQSNSVAALSIALVAYAIVWLLPDLPNPIFSGVMRSSVFLVLSIVLIYYFKLSPDFNTMLTKFRTKLRL